MSDFSYINKVGMDVFCFHNSITDEYKVSVVFKKQFLSMLDDEYDIQISSIFSDKFVSESLYNSWLRFELDEDDIKYIVSLLTDIYHYNEEQKFKLIRRSLKLEKYASSNPLAYSYENDYIEDEIIQFEEDLNEIKLLISRFYELITTLNKMQSDLKTIETLKEAKQKCIEWEETKKFILEKIEEVQKTRKLLKENETDPIIILLQSEELDKNENYWNDMLRRADTPINECNNTYNSFKQKINFHYLIDLLL